MSDFYKELQCEQNFYINTLKPFFKKRKYDCVFLRYNDGANIFEIMQRKYDIDVIVDSGYKNITLSIKVVKAIYKAIFFETVSNCTKKTEGWGYTGKADFTCYAMQNANKWRLIFFKCKDIRKLNIEKYPIRYGETFIGSKLIYKTEGRLIPVRDFTSTVIELH